MWFRKKFGYWKISSKQPPYIEIIECSECGSWFQVTKKCNEKQLFSFCPHCGLPMKYTVTEEEV